MRYKIIIAFILFVSCNAKIGKKQCQTISYITYYDEENTKVEMKGQTDCAGKFHGVQYHFFYNGDTVYVINYNHGVLNGMKIRWHENGRKASFALYSNGSLKKLKMWDTDSTLIIDTIYEKPK